MSTIIMNGSPKAEHGNTEIFIRKLIEGMQQPCDVCYAAKEDCNQLARRLQEYDKIIIAFPLYVHAMPGIVKKVLDCMKPLSEGRKDMGFIIQYGFVEGAQSQYVTRYLETFVKRMKYNYLGTLAKGGSSGVSEMPEKMNRQLFERLHLFGRHYAETGTFSKEIIAAFKEPYELTKKQSHIYEFLSRLGLTDAIFWNMKLKKNHAKDKRFDRPF